MQSTETAAILALLLSPGTGPVAVGRMMAAARFTDQPISALLDVPIRELLEMLPPGLEDVAADVSRCDARYRERAARLLEQVAEAGATALTVDDSEYPASLSRFLGETAAPLLFVLGDTELLARPAAAVVGASSVSKRGARLAAASAKAFGREGIVVVSGGAQGVDSAAHEAALATGGETVVVLPQGLLTYRAPAELFEAIDEGRAAIVSEFVPDAMWETHAAVTRNATISALSRLVCVVEPKKTGGSIRTARYAVEQGKRVTVYCPGGPESPGETLARAGALDLLSPSGRFSARHLLDMWHSAPEPPVGQTELF